MSQADNSTQRDSCVNGAACSPGQGVQCCGNNPLGRWPGETQQWSLQQEKNETHPILFTRNAAAHHRSGPNAT